MWGQTHGRTTRNAPRAPQCDAWMCAGPADAATIEPAAAHILEALTRTTSADAQVCTFCAASVPVGLGFSMKAGGECPVLGANCSQVCIALGGIFVLFSQAWWHPISRYRINMGFPGTVSTPNIGPLQTLAQELRPQKKTLADPTYIFMRPHVLCWYGSRVTVEIGSVNNLLRFVLCC